MSAAKSHPPRTRFKRQVGQFFAGIKYARGLETDDLRGPLNYPGAADRFLDISVMGAPPGMGSLYGAREGEKTFFIDDEPRPRNPAPNDPRGENFALFGWFRREFADFFVEDELHYVDYQKLRQAPLPDPGYRTERYAMFFDVEQRGISDDENLRKDASVVLRLPSGAEIHRRVPRATEPRTVFSRPVPFAFGGVSGHLYVIRGHALSIVQRRGPDTVVTVVPSPEVDSAAFVGGDGRTLWLTAPAGTRQFAPASGPLPVEAPTFTGGLQWREPASPLPPITNAVIEEVPLLCFW